MARPNRTFLLLVGLGIALIAALSWSTHHLLLAGAPALAAGGGWPSFSCLLFPVADDFAPHLASYAFMLAMAAGAASGLRTLVRQHCQTRALLRACLAVYSPRRAAIPPSVSVATLHDRLDIVDLPTPIAFCYGYFRPRVIVSTGLIELLPTAELEALLLHEREHLHQRDPLKLALGRLLSSALFFVPALGALYQRYLVEKELAADRAAIAEQGGSAGLSGALARLVERGAEMQVPFGAGAGDELEARIDSLLGEPARLELRLGPGGFAFSILLGALAALPLLATPLPSNIVASNHNVVAGCHLATQFEAR